MRFGFSRSVTARDVQDSLHRIEEERQLPDTAAKPASRRTNSAPRQHRRADQRPPDAPAKDAPAE